LGVLLSVSYDGRPYHGFVEQRGLITVASELLAAVRSIDPSIERIVACSRTDRGVHARDQRVSFTPSKPFPLTAWTHGAQRRLPHTVSIRRAWEVEDDYFPRASVASKTYRYTLLVDAARDPFLEGLAWRVWDLDPGQLCEALNVAAAPLVGTHDFAAFRGAQDDRDSTVRTLTRVHASRALDDERLIFVDVSGSGFLYHMVRIIVGTLVDVARGRASADAVQRMLETLDRRHGGITAPPDGLCLQAYDLAGIDSPARPAGPVGGAGPSAEKLSSAGGPP
jgi:tRNA pseudouridine38-40 synthase